jgi:hypothetical protein
MDDIATQRYQPRNGSGIVDTKTGRFHARDYSVTEIQDTVRWLNERNNNYPLGSIGAIKV